MSLTNAIRHGLRVVQVASISALGIVLAAPAVASTLPKPPTRSPLTHPLTQYNLASQADKSVSPAALAADGAPVATDLQLAKQTAHSKPQTAAIPVHKPKPKVSVGTGQVAAAVQVKPKITPAKDVPKPAPAKAVEPKPVPKPVAPKPSPSKVAAVLSYARGQIGERYVMGGAGPYVWDCSGLTMRAFQAVGIDIGGHGVNVQYQKARRMGYLVPWSQRRAGDLVFYGVPGAFSHVAISAGGDTIIEAANPARPVLERHYWGRPYGMVARFIR